MIEISVAEFKKRIVDFFVRSNLYELPSKRKDRLIVLKAFSMALTKNDYSEKEVNEIIKGLLGKIISIQIDYVKIRRALVDEGFLDRTSDGSRYSHNENYLKDIFDENIDSVDVLQLITQAKQEIKERSAKHKNNV